MAAHKHIILGVHVTDRLKDATKVQAVLTEFGCNIKTRIGLHDVAGTVCSGTGVVLLEITSSEDVAKKIAVALDAIDGVQTKMMVFAH